MLVRVERSSKPFPIPSLYVENVANLASSDLHRPFQEYNVLDMTNFGIGAGRVAALKTRDHAPEPGTPGGAPLAADQIDQIERFPPE
jgi:hypothetical protein